MHASVRGCWITMTMTKDAMLNAVCSILSHIEDYK
jgi:hypothetical protein